MQQQQLPAPQQQQPQIIYYQPQPPSLVELQPTGSATAIAGLTINPALLEAASIARRDHDVVNDNDEDVQQAAWQMMQLRRGNAATPQPLPQAQCQPQSQPQPQPTLHISDLAANYDDTHEANVLIEHFKRGDLVHHGLHKGYVPVPLYE